MNGLGQKYGPEGRVCDCEYDPLTGETDECEGCLDAADPSTTWVGLQDAAEGLLGLTATTHPARCTCGALFYRGCFCGIKVGEFMATGGKRGI